MESLRVAIIGGTGGLGQALARYYAKHNAIVTVFGRTFRDQEISNIKFTKIDLSLMSNIKELVKSDDKFNLVNFDLIIFTAGIFSSISRQETTEGLELDLASSYINRYLLLDKSLLKLKQIKEDNKNFENNNKFFSNFEKPRIFIMAYPGDNQLGTIDDINQEKSYGVLKAHMNTVAGNESIVTHYSNEKLINIYGLNPGIIKTNIRNNLFGNGIISKVMEYFIGLLNPTPEEYANLIGPLLINSKLENKSGTFYNNKGEEIKGSNNLNKEYADKFIEKSKDLLINKGLYD